MNKDINKNSKQNISALDRVKQATEEMVDNRKDALDNESRVKVLSPGMLVFKRFVRNKLAVVGFTMLAVMFLFSFVGPIFSPYTQTQLFTREELVYKDYANAKYNSDLLPVLRSDVKPNDFKKIKSKFILAKNKGASEFEVSKDKYSITKLSDDAYIINDSKEAGKFVIKGSMALLPKNPLYTDGFKEAFDKAFKADEDKFTYKDTEYTIFRNKMDSKILIQNPYALISKNVVYPFAEINNDTVNNLQYRITAEKAIIDKQSEFTFQNRKFLLNNVDDHSIGITEEYNGEVKKIALITDLIVTPNDKSEFLSMDYLLATMDAIRNKDDSFIYTHKDSDGNEKEEEFKISLVNGRFTIKNQRTMLLFDTNSAPSREHLCGTDAQGMDVLTRLMYGGRISLMVGFVVVFLEIFIGILFGGVSGYFGGWVDNIIMRFIDLFNSIPSFPLMIIIGSVMDTMEVPSTKRIFLLMLLLGLLGWTGIARVVRGQILSLREQDFMIATEATGLSINKRIFRHLVPNVMPLLIVQATMSLGGIIIYEATLSFLGLGVKPPLASWGSIVNAANDLYIMKTCWWIWIPTGLLIVLTVLGFNFVGDGLRDAYDPKMKR